MYATLAMPGSAPCCGPRLAARAPISSRTRVAEIRALLAEIATSEPDGEEAPWDLPDGLRRTLDHWLATRGME